MADTEGIDRLTSMFARLWSRRQVPAIHTAVPGTRHINKGYGALKPTKFALACRCSTPLLSRDGF